MAGQGIPAYRDFVQRAVPPLATAAGSDTDLAGQITSAAAVDAAGATRLDTLAAQVKTLAADAPSATTANQQRAILTALRDNSSRYRRSCKPPNSKAIRPPPRSATSHTRRTRPPRVVTAPFSRSTTARKRRRHMVMIRATGSTSPRSWRFRRVGGAQWVRANRTESVVSI